LVDDADVAIVDEEADGSAFVFAADADVVDASAVGDCQKLCVSSVT
jgi:hypothetical protein